MNVNSQTVWSVGPDNIATPSNRAIIVAKDYAFAHIDDISRIVPVDSGLKLADFVVFLSFYGPTEENSNTQTRTEGYFVSHVDNATDGTGVLVHGNSLESYPDDLMTDQLLTKLHKLEQADSDYLEEFNLLTLGLYIKNRRQNTALMSKHNSLPLAT